MVKINEFFDSRETTEPKIDYDPGQDLIIFMQNDPMFYRKHLYPAMIDCETAQANGEINYTKPLFPVVDKAVMRYCKKYDIPHEPTKLFPKEIRVQIAKDLMDPEKLKGPLK